MAATTTIPKGTVLGGKYRVDREIGRGGMAAVYEAVNLDIHKRVAIKLLAGHLAASQTVVTRFLREARAVSQINSPHICDVYDAGELDDGTPYLVLELLEGESLYEAMVRDRQMSSNLTLAIVLQVCRGLAKAHALGIVHRDLKPENIFLTVDAEGELLVKVLDFGLAKFYDPVGDDGDRQKSRLTREGAVFGTPAYMSPEQVRGQAAADTRADLWALACITYECFTGTTVWSTEDGVAMTFAQIATAPIPDPARYRPDLPAAFLAWFQRALDRDINVRFQEVRGFADSLAEAFDHRARGGGLDANLVSTLSSRAVAEESDAVTVRRSLKDLNLDLPGDSPPSSKQAPAAGSLGATEMSTGLSRKRQQMLAVGGAVVALAAIVVGVMLAGDDPPAPVAAQRVGKHFKRFHRDVPSRPSGAKHVAGHPWLPRVREAQLLVSQGQHDKALALLRKIDDTAKHGMIDNLMGQVQVAIAARRRQASCQVAGLARPRRYTLLGQDRKPTNAIGARVVWGAPGAIITWIDNRDGQRHAYAVPIDQALRNDALPADVTPEGVRIGTPRVLPTGNRYVMAYSDSLGAAPGVQVRLLSYDSSIDGRAIHVGQKKPGSHSADIAPSEDGFAVAWVGPGDSDSHDVFYRLLDGKGQPKGGAVRVTDFSAQGRGRVSARAVRVAVRGGHVHLVYSIVRRTRQEVRYQRVPIATKAPGLSPRRDEDETDRSITRELPVSPPGARAIQPEFACAEAACYVSWAFAAKGGAGVAMIDIDKGERRWFHRLVKAKNASIAVDRAGQARAIWIQDGHLTTGTVGKRGLGPTSKVAKVLGELPPPSITAGSKPGDWYLGWVDYEAPNHLEPYAARIRCK